MRRVIDGPGGEIADPFLVLASQNASKLSQRSSSLCTSSFARNVGNVVFVKAQGQNTEHIVFREIHIRNLQKVEVLLLLVINN